MILTNALLSIGFSLIANFTNTIAVPCEQVPTRIEDLREYSIGGVSSPTDLVLVHRRGTVFDVKHGAVTRFLSPDSLTHLQDPTLLPQFRGTPHLTSTQIVELAE